MTVLINNLCVIGTGLIGGSFCLSLKQAGACRHIVGAGRSEATLQKALQLDIIDHYETDIELAVKDADVVFVSVPLGAMASVFKQIKTGLNKAGNSKAVVTDAGSSKQQVVQLAAEIFDANDGDAKNGRSEDGVVEGEFGACRFVAGHPIAGTENSGPEAAFAELYKDRRVILTPSADTDADAITLVTELWQATGAMVETMDAAHHDKVLAATSHLPHILAFGLVHCLENMDDIENVFRFAAGGFRDVTRIASSDPVMWRDICLNNQKPILEMMQRYRDELDMLYNALESGDGEKLKEIFEHAKKTRDKFTH
ncbi:MAG: prephenate dehydrogenase/arogenate dehydrogenase family protein [Proteobacteria bacterium]|nr:prephenate dehydrogenase/arogenate dehydrogenase family protein [Pseudomonadota bacterium]